MAMAIGGSRGPQSDINMTPMIDVLLVLLIIFMVITPLTPKGLEALVPQPNPNPQQPNAEDRTVVIIIDKDKKMMLNTEPTDETRLGRAPEGGLQDPRREGGVREGRSVAGIQGRGQGDRYRQGRRHRQGRSDDREDGGW